MENREKEKQERLDEIVDQLREELMIESQHQMNKKQIDEEINKMIKEGLIDEYEDILNEQEMYFKEPYQLEENFVQMEEKSLFLISQT